MVDNNPVSSYIKLASLFISMTRSVASINLRLGLLRAALTATSIE
jgi:hypothetical protein